MELLQEWKPEIVGIINEKNNLSLTVSDVTLTLVSNTANAVVVRVTPAEGSPYFNEQTLTYVPRDLAKAFHGLPIRIIVAADTTIRDLVQTISTRFGVSFDQAVDFTQAELDKVVDFSTSGVQEIEIPAAETSFVWVGKLPLTVANDGLDLETLIKNVNLTSLSYLTGSSTQSALQLASIAVDWTGVYEDQKLGDLIVGSMMTRVQAGAVADAIIEQSGVPASERDELIDMIAGNEVHSVAEVDGVKITRVGPISGTNWGGELIVAYAAGQPPALINLNDLFPNLWELDLASTLSAKQFGVSGEILGKALTDTGANGVQVFAGLMTPYLYVDHRGVSFTDEDVAKLSNILTQLRDEANYTVTHEQHSADVGVTILLEGKGNLEGTFEVNVKASGVATGDQQLMVNPSLSDFSLELFKTAEMQKIVLRGGSQGHDFYPLFVKSLFVWNEDHLEPRSDLVLGGDEYHWLLSSPSVPGVSVTINRATFDEDNPRIDLSKYVSEGFEDRATANKVGVIAFDFNGMLALDTSQVPVSFLYPVFTDKLYGGYGIVPNENGGLASPEVMRWMDISSSFGGLGQTDEGKALIGITDADLIEKLMMVGYYSAAMLNNGAGDVFVSRNEVNETIYRIVPNKYNEFITNELLLIVQNMPNVMDNMGVSIPASWKAGLDAIREAGNKNTGDLAAVFGTLTVQSAQNVRAVLSSVLKGFDANGNVLLHPFVLKAETENVYTCPDSFVKIDFEVYEEI